MMAQLDLVTEINAAMTARLGGVSASSRTPGSMEGTGTQDVYSAYGFATGNNVYNASSIAGIAPAVDLTDTCSENGGGVVDGGSLISPTFASMAAHVGMTAGRTFRYVDGGNSTTNLTVADWRQIPGSDLLIVKFATPAPLGCTPKKRLPANYANYFQLTYFPNWPGTPFLGATQLSAPFLVTPVLVLFIDRIKSINVAQWVGDWEYLASVSAPYSYPTFYTYPQEGTSGNDIFIVMPNGDKITLAEWYTSGAGVAQADLLAQINAAIDAMGGSSSDHLQTYDLSAYQTYAAPVVPPPVTYPPPIPAPLLLESNMATTFTVRPIGGQYATIQQAVADAAVMGATGTVYLVCQGSVGPLTLAVDTLLCTNLFIIGDAGWTPGLINLNDSAVANMSTLSITDAGNATAAFNCTVSLVGMQIGNSSSSGLTAITFSDPGEENPGVGSVFTNFSAVNCRWRSAVTLGTGTKNLITIAGSATNPASGIPIGTASFAACVMAIETAGSSTNISVLSVSNTASIINVNIYQCDLDITHIKGTGVGVKLAASQDGTHTYMATTNFAYSNSVITGASTSQATFSTSVSGTSVINITGDGLISSDSQTNGTSLTHGVLAGTVWANASANDYTLHANSPAIGLYTTTLVNTGGINGIIWPRMVNRSSLVDGGAGGFVVQNLPITLTKSGQDLTLTWTNVAGTSSAKVSKDGAAYATHTSPWTDIGAANAGHSYVVENLDAAPNILAQGAAGYTVPSGNAGALLVLGIL